MFRHAIAFIIFVSVAPAQQALPTLKQIMDEPSWYALTPEPVGWLADGSGVVWDIPQRGVIARDQRSRMFAALDGLRIVGTPIMLEEHQRAGSITSDGVFSPDRERQAASYQGDLFLRARDDAAWTQLTRTTQTESEPRFAPDGNRLFFRRDGVWTVRDLNSGLESHAADIRAGEDPATKEEKQDDLGTNQRRLFRTLRENKEREDLNRTADDYRRSVDATRVPGPFYLGKDRRSVGAWLSPSGRSMLVATAGKEAPDDKQDIMPSYVTEDGYVSTSRVRPKVGVETREPVSFVLLDLSRGVSIALGLDALEGIHDDPLAPIRDAARARRSPGVSITGPDDPAGGKSPNQPPTDGSASDKPERTPRAVGVMGVRWSDSGQTGAVMLRSHDNKDRWIVAIDTADDAIGKAPKNDARASFRQIHRLHDPAWINWEFNEFGFVPGTESVWFLSEHTGYGHLYRSERGSDAPFALSAGPFEVRSVTPAHDGSGFFVRTNRGDPGVYELERIAPDGTHTALTALGGTVESYLLSPDHRRVLYTWSSAMSPPDLFVTDAARPTAPVRLTDSATPAFRALRMTAPELIDIPSTHAARPIRTRVYRPDASRFEGARPIVIFAHGAGYLQFANNGWSYYAREHMFHTLLTERGAIVLGPDFRASEGYGRAWRTAVYRDMGGPELEDFDDCIAYAAESLGGDPERVGIYGGSYGGFMTLMAMFLRPDVYDAGAALRSVTDWRQYNDGYTANILDTPAIDPEPFDRCSPITHAEGLAGRLLMCHGMLDDNVVAQDIIRLSQRLIELEKTGWELALYPLEPHGFREPSSWHDAYRRILGLFEDTILRSAP